MTAPMAPAEHIRLLLLAAPGKRADQIMLGLRATGLPVDETRVSHASALATELREHTWDAVISDFESPGLSGLVALRIVRATGLDLPFLFVSSAAGTAAAVAAITLAACSIPLWPIDIAPVEVIAQE